MNETVYWLYYRDNVQMISIKRYEVGGPKMCQHTRWNGDTEYISVAHAARLLWGANRQNITIEKEIF